MNPHALVILSLAFAGSALRPAAADSASPAVAAPATVATFECIGLYWSAPEARECSVQFRRAGTEPWRGTLPLVYDARDHEYRCSIVGLEIGRAHV